MLFILSTFQCPEDGSLIRNIDKIKFHPKLQLSAQKTPTFNAKYLSSISIMLKGKPNQSQSESAILPSFNQCPLSRLHGQNFDCGAVIVHMIFFIGSESCQETLKKQDRMRWGFQTQKPYETIKLDRKPYSKIGRQTRK